MGFVAFLGDPVVCLGGHHNRRLDFVLDPERETDFIHLGLSANLMWGLKADSWFSSSDHFSELISQSSDFQSSSPNGTLLTTKFRVGMSSARLKP